MKASVFQALAVIRPYRPLVKPPHFGVVLTLCEIQERALPRTVEAKPAMAWALLMIRASVTP